MQIGKTLCDTQKSQDETHVKVKYPLFWIVCPKDEKPRVKANWAPNPRTSVHGCIDNDGKLTTIEEDRANGETRCKFLEAVAVQIVRVKLG